MIRQGDLYLYNTDDGGAIEIKSGEPVMDPGLETATFLSLFSNGSEDHWMNEYLTGAMGVGCKFYPYVSGNAKTASTIRKARNYCLSDLAWMKKEGLADEIEVEVISQDARRIELTVDIKKDKNTLVESKYEINWESQANNPASGRV